MEISLFRKVFNNIVLSTKIYTFVHEQSIFGYRKIRNYELLRVFKNKTLTEIWCSSYKFNNDIGNGGSGGSGNDLENKRILDKINEDSSFLFTCKYLSADMFTIIFENLFGNIYKETVPIRVIEQCISFSNNLGILKYLLNYNGNKFRFDQLQYRSFIKQICIREKNIQNVEFLQFIIDYFNENGLPAKPDSLEDYIKISKLNLPIDILYKCMDYRNDQYYNIIFPLCIDHMLSPNSSNDMVPKKLGQDGNKLSKQNTLLCQIVFDGCVEMAKLYCKQFPNQKCEGHESILFKTSGTFEDTVYGRVLSYSLLVENGTFKCCHSPFKEFSFLAKISIKDFKPLIDYYVKKGKKIKTKMVNIYSVKDIETLKFLVENKNIFQQPHYTLDASQITISAMRDSILTVEMIKIISQLPNSHIGEVKYGWNNCSPEVVKHYMSTVNQFNDMGLSYAYHGDLEFLKYIINGHLSKNPQIKLTHCSLDRICERGYFELANYLLKEASDLPISREAINDAIKSGNLDLVNLLKNVVPTKKGDNITLYDTTITYIIDNNRHDIYHSLCDSIYKNTLINKLKQNTIF